MIVGAACKQVNISLQEATWGPHHGTDTAVPTGNAPAPSVAEQAVNAAHAQLSADFSLLVDCLRMQCSEAAVNRLLQCPRPSLLQMPAQEPLFSPTCEPDQAAAGEAASTPVPARRLAAAVLLDNLLAVLVAVVAAQACTIIVLSRSSRAAASAVAAKLPASGAPVPESSAGNEQEKGILHAHSPGLPSRTAHALT